MEAASGSAIVSSFIVTVTAVVVLKGIGQPEDDGSTQREAREEGMSTVS